MNYTSLSPKKYTEISNKDIYLNNTIEMMIEKRLKDCLELVTNDHTSDKKIKNDIVIIRPSTERKTAG
tara:strand:+ start:143 stop:346 length:204 start_codon:yes stop_codon:yes gene_type:complete